MMEHVIVERVFTEPVTDADLLAMAERASGCYESLRVRRIRSYMSLDRKRMVCEYEAPDAESVRRASDTARIPYVHVWTAHVIPAEP
jgi:hypothetical protein